MRPDILAPVFFQFVWQTWVHHSSAQNKFQKNSDFVKNWNFGETLEFWLNIEILAKNRNFG